MQKEEEIKGEFTEEENALNTLVNENLEFTFDQSIL